jgi:hypothetical protein
MVVTQGEIIALHIFENQMLKIFYISAHRDHGSGNDNDSATNSE